MANTALGSLLHYLCRLQDHAAEATDGELLRRHVGGDQAAFAALVHRHAPMVWGVCRRLLDNEHDAEDAFQAAFLVLLRKAESLRVPQSLAAFLHGVAARIARKAQVTAQRRRRHEAQAEMPRPSDPFVIEEQRELRALLDEELDRLPEKYRAPLVLCYLEGLSYTEAARQLGWRDGTVCGRLARARELLRQRLSRRGLTLSGAALAIALSEPATVPAMAMATVSRMAALVALGQAAAGSVSPTVATLAQGVLQAMTVAKLKALAATALLLILATGTGLGTLGLGVLAQHQQAAEPTAKIAETKPTNAEFQKSKQPRLDLYRDPLPEGAIARLGTVRLYHGGEVWRLLYAPDGNTVISAGRTETIRFWDVNSGKEVRQFVVPQRKVPDGQRMTVSSLALSSDGKTLAAATWNRAIPSGAIYLWDIASGKLLHASPGDQGKPVYSLAFSHNDKLLASGHILETGSEVRLWEVSTGKELRRLAVKDTDLCKAVFSPVRDTLAVVNRDATISIVDAVDGKVLHKLVGHCNGIIDISFSRDGKTLASIEAGRHMNDSEYSVRLWDVETGRQLRKLGHQHSLWAVAFGIDGMLAASDGNNDGISEGIHFWDSHSGKQLRQFSGPLFDVRRLAFSPDGKTLAYANSKGLISFCDVGSAMQVRRMPRHQAGLRTVAISPDGRTLATASDDSSVGLWDVSSAKELRNLKGHTESVRFVAFSPNGKFLASAANNHRAYAHNYEVILWDRAMGKEVRRFKGCCLAFSPDGKQIACGGFDDENNHRVPPGIIWLHDAETGKLMRRFRGHKLGVQNIAFSPDGKTLASASSGYPAPGIENAPIEDFKLRLWDVASGCERCRLERCRIGSWRWNIHPSFLTFSPDGRLLVADAVECSNKMDVEGADRMYVWEVATGKNVELWISRSRCSRTPFSFCPIAEHLRSETRVPKSHFWTWRPARSWVESEVILAPSTVWFCPRTPRHFSPEAPTRPRLLGIWHPLSRRRPTAWHCCLKAAWKHSGATWPVPTPPKPIGRSGPSSLLQKPASPS